MRSLKAPAPLQPNPPTVKAPDIRMRRLRRTEALRDLVRETHLSVDDFIYPLFVEEGQGEPQMIRSMPGVSRETENSLAHRIDGISDSGIKAVMLFGVSHNKD